MPKCEVSGSGLKAAIAGDHNIISVRCRDRFSNPTLPGSSLSFGLAIAPPAAAPEKADKKDKKDKNKTDMSETGGEKGEKGSKSKDSEEEAACTLPSKDFEGTWRDEGEYEIKYIAEKAGDFELHLWCDTDGNGVRQKLPGSPFLLHVTAARASATGSRVTGAEVVRTTALVAGERLELGIQLRDPYGNPCPAPERVRAKVAAAAVVEEEDDDDLPSRGYSRGGSRGRSSIGVSSSKKDSKAVGERQDKGEEGVTAILKTPHDEQVLTDKLRPGDGLGIFSLAYELHVAGMYEAHLSLSGSHITGSPVLFQVKPAAPSGRLSTLQSPDMPPYVHVQYELLLIAEDKYSNKLDRGGASVQARALGPSASPATTHDYNDGTYGVRFTAGAVGEYRVEVRLDNVKIKGSPHVITFTQDHRKRADEGNAPAAAGPTDADGNQMPLPPEQLPPPFEDLEFPEQTPSPPQMRPDSATKKVADSSRSRRVSNEPA